MNPSDPTAKGGFRGSVHRTIFGLLGLMILVGHLRAQQPALESHQVNADDSVTFRYFAPTAHEVRVSLDYSPDFRALTKGADGVWIFKSGPLSPALHMYSFMADGVPVFDPYNPAVDPSYYYVTNRFVISGAKPQLWDETDVPHGAIQHHFYHTSIMANLPNGTEDYYVYTPPGYAASGAERYPVLYLLHGWAAKSDSWLDQGQANFILDNLIAQGRARPMLVVMPLSYGDFDFVRKGPNQWNQAAPVTRNERLFAQGLLSELMPQVEAQYRIAPGRNQHAIAGLSMGGGESLILGLNHPNIFGTVAGFSSGFGPEGFDTDFSHLAASPALKPDLLWLSCGTDDGLIAPNRQLAGWLRKRGFQPEVVETPGIHNWLTWRDHFIRFASEVFPKGRSGSH